MATAVKAAGSLLQPRRCEVDWLYVKMLHQNVEKWMTHRFVLSMKQSLQKWVVDRFWNTKNRPHLKRLRKFDACKCTATASAASIAVSYQGLPANVLHWQSLLGGVRRKKHFTNAALAFLTQPKTGGQLSDFLNRGYIKLPILGGSNNTNLCPGLWVKFVPKLTKKKPTNLGRNFTYEDPR